MPCVAKFEPKRRRACLATQPAPRRYALEYLKSNWDRLWDFDEALSGVNIDEMRKAVQPLLVAEGAGLLLLSWWYVRAGNAYVCTCLGLS